MNARRIPHVLLLLLLVTGAASGKERFGGIGISVAQLYDSSTPDHRGSLVVLHVMEGSPAAAAGLRGGDVITHVDGEATAGRDFAELVLEKLRGPVGSVLDLTVRRQETGESFEMAIPRTEIVHRADG